MTSHSPQAEAEYPSEEPWTEDTAEPYRQKRRDLGEAIGAALKQCGITVRWALAGPAELYDVADVLLQSPPIVGALRGAFDAGMAVKREADREALQNALFEADWYSADKWEDSGRLTNVVLGVIREAPTTCEHGSALGDLCAAAEHRANAEAPPKVPHPALELHPNDAFFVGFGVGRQGCSTCRVEGDCQTRQLLLKGDSDA